MIVVMESHGVAFEKDTDCSLLAITKLLLMVMIRDFVGLQVVTAC